MKCVFQETILSGTEPLDYYWLDSNENVVSYDSTLCLTANAGNAGTYTFFAGNGCGTSTCTSTLTVDEAPQVSSSGDQTACIGNTACFTGTVISGTEPVNTYWVDGNNNFISFDEPVLCLTANQNNGGNYYFYALNGCGYDSIGVQLTVNPLPDSTVTTSTVCNGYSGTLTAASGNYTYQWSDPLNSTTQSITVSDSNTYYVLITDTITGCQNYGSGKLNIQYAPQVSCSGDQEVCYGSYVCFTGTVLSGTNPDYFWYDSNDSIVSFDLDLCLIANDTTAGTYYFDAYEWLRL